MSWALFHSYVQTHWLVPILPIERMVYKILGHIVLLVTLLASCILLQLAPNLAWQWTGEYSRIPNYLQEIWSWLYTKQIRLYP